VALLSSKNSVAEGHCGRVSTQSGRGALSSSNYSEWQMGAVVE